MFFFFDDKQKKGKTKRSNTVSPEVSGTSESPFERIKRFDDNGQEYWSARDLMSILEYTEFGKFKPAITRAMKACEGSSQAIGDHFARVSDMVDIGSKAKRTRENYHLTRFACYLIVQNADATKEMVALGQTYFAIQTRRQELQDDFEQLTEDQQRIAVRGQLKKHNQDLADAAQDAGVVRYGVFQNYGYKGLYGGLTAKEIHEQKGLKKAQQILDHMGSTELAANLFRATQTAEKLRRDNVKNEVNANNTHYHVGKAVRKTIKDLGGTMPEDLPTCEDIKKVERKIQKLSAGCEPNKLNNSTQE